MLDEPSTMPKRAAVTGSNGETRSLTTNQATPELTQQDATPTPRTAASIAAADLPDMLPKPALPAQVISETSDTPADADKTAALEPVRIHVAEESWVEVRTDERIFYTGVKQAGEILSVPGDMASQAKLTTGNAGGIWVSVGDWTSQTLGKQGRVRRGLLLAPEALLATLQSADPS